MPARFMVIGLDGADGHTLDWASKDGTLPNLTKLRARGRGWRLSAGRDNTDDSLWASFHYGVAVGTHGRYNSKVQDNAGRTRFAVHDENDWETFWEKIGHAGPRVAVLDMPKSRLPRRLNGIHLADWLVHGRYFQPGPLSYPETLAAEVVARFGAAPHSRCDYTQQDPLDDAAIEGVCSNLYRSVRQKRDASLFYLSQERWDLFMVGFKEAHCSAHMLWDFNDPTHVKYDAARVARLGNPVLDILKAQDLAIGDLVAGAGPEANILIFSMTDFAPNGTLMHLMTQIAAGINRYVRTLAEDDTAASLLSEPVSPRRFCRSISYSDDAGALSIPRQTDDTDLSYMSRVDLIVQLARELVDPADGLPVVSAVSYPSFERTGTRSASLPQVLLHYRTNICPSTVSSPRLGKISAQVPAMRSGNHAPGGFALACGSFADAAASQVGRMEDFAAMLSGKLVVADADVLQHAVGQ